MQTEDEFVDNKTRLSAGSVFVVGKFSVADLRESLPVAFFDFAHGSEQMEIGIGPELFGLAVKKFDDERVKNPDLFQCFHVAMDASEGCIEAVKEIVNEGFLYAGRIVLSHDSPFDRR
jgi:hypothetical protein